MMKKLNRFSALAAAVSLTMLLGGGMVSNVHAEGDRDGGGKHVEQGENGRDGKHGEHHRDGGHWGHDKWQMFKGLNLTSAQKEQIKNIMKGHHKEFTEGKIAALQARQNLDVGDNQQHIRSSCRAEGIQRYVCGTGENDHFTCKSLQRSNADTYTGSAGSGSGQTCKVQASHAKSHRKAPIETGISG